MRRRKQLIPSVERVEQRLSLSAVDSATRYVTVSGFEMENTLITNVQAPAPRPQAGQQIIAILIG